MGEERGLGTEESRTGTWEKGLNGVERQSRRGICQLPASSNDRACIHCRGLKSANGKQTFANTVEKACHYTTSLKCQQH